MLTTPNIHIVIVKDYDSTIVMMTLMKPLLQSIDSSATIIKQCRHHKCCNNSDNHVVQPKSNQQAQPNNNVLQKQQPRVIQPTTSTQQVQPNNNLQQQLVQPTPSNQLLQQTPPAQQHQSSFNGSQRQPIQICQPNHQKHYSTSTVSNSERSDASNANGHHSKNPS